MGTYDTRHGSPLHDPSADNDSCCNRCGREAGNCVCEDKIVWVIEKCSGSLAPHYRAFNATTWKKFWTQDFNVAIRFTSKAEANYFVEIDSYDREVRVVEHRIIRE